MPRRFIQLFLVALFAGGLLALTHTTRAQSTPTMTPLARPDYDYAESNRCPTCHLTDGRAAEGDHMREAVGVMFDTGTSAFKFTGSGWRASQHAQSNYKSTQNTYCAKCHSPLQAKPEAAFRKGMFVDTEQIADGKLEGVTCATCHPPSSAIPVLGRRLGIYQWGMDKTKAESYKAIPQGQEDLLCLNCHVERHNEDNSAFLSMYNAGVRCVDCHMAVYGEIHNSEIEKRAHDFKVAKNLPYSCGVEGSVSHCHPGFTSEGTLEFIPYLKQQHVGWWPLKPGKAKHGGAVAPTSSEYMNLWLQLDSKYRSAK